MAKHRLAEALRAGQTIEQGIDYPDKFSKVCVDYDLQLEKEAGGVYSIQYSFDGKLLAVGCGNGTIKLYETRTGKKLPDIRKTRYGGFPIMALRFHPKNNNHIYAATSEGQVLDCDISDFIHDGNVDLSHIDSDKNERWTEIIVEKKGSAKNEINCMDFDYTLTKFATGGKDLSIRIYDAKTNQLISEYTGYDNTKDPTDLQFSGCAERVFALKFHPKYDDIFVTGGWDRHLKIWDARAHDGVKRTIHGPQVCGDALDLKEYKILTGSYCGKDALQIWNYNGDYGIRGKDKPKVVDFPAGDKGPFLYAAQFCDNDVVVAGGSGTNSAMAINTETNQVLGEVKFNHPVQAIDTALGGRLFAVGDGDRCLKMCSLK